ncbi:MAG: hypothetical protein NTW59_01305, partial [Candidatus Diapherotrites archaeon]|nr:hypothetical protein [Candidatus Diapherotrites archaeon]
MKYNLVRFNSAVAYYKRALKGKAGKGKTCLVVLPMTNKKAFFSIAPLSRALHESGCDVNVFAVGWESRSLPVLLLTWKLFGELKQGRKTKATA